MTLLYIIPEYPSVSQTFIANEVAAADSLGVKILVYPLTTGAAARSTADVHLLSRPPSRWALSLAALASAPAFLASRCRDRRPRLNWRELPRLWLAFAHVWHVTRLIRKHGVVVGHVHAHFFGRSADVASLLARHLGCKWTVTAHGGDVYAPPEPALMRRRLSSVAGVACANGGVRSRLVEMAAPAKPRTELVHCGVDTRAVVATRSSAEAVDGHHIVTVGRLVATKGYWTILDAVASLLERYEDVRWSIVGDGPLRDELKNDPRSVKLGGQVEFLGSLNHAEALSVVATANLFVLPCEPGANGWSDGIPVALMEAMALGVVVVTTAVGGIAELVASAETGFLVTPSDSGELAEILDRLLASPPHELDRIREAARQKVEQDFDLHRETGKLLAFLEPYGVGNRYGRSESAPVADDRGKVA